MRIRNSQFDSLPRTHILLLSPIAQDHVIRHFAKRMWNRLPNFEEMDRDGNGTLERDEVASAIQALTGEPIQDAALDHFFLCVDGDNDGRITLDEWKRVKRHGK